MKTQILDPITSSLTYHSYFDNSIVERLDNPELERLLSRIKTELQERDDNNK